MLKNKSIWVISALASAMALTACQPSADKKTPEQEVDSQSASEAQQQVLILKGETESVPVSLPGCSGNSCPEFSVDRLHTNQFVLDDLIDQAIMKQLKTILEMTDQEQDQSKKTDNKKDSQADKAKADQQQSASEANFNLTPVQLLAKQVQPYVNQFIDLDKELKTLGASHQISLSISPKILNSQEPLATVVLNTSSYLGGAHGSSSQTYYNFDLKHQKQVSLDQLIQANQKAKLNTLAHDAFKAWVTESKLAENVNEYEQAWKFTLSDNFYLGKQGLILQYGEYEIGPYVVGLPRLTIPYDKLKGILKPEFLPTAFQAQPAASEAVVTKSEKVKS